MNKKITRLLLMTFLVVSCFANAADGQGGFAIWGVGKKSCHHYMQAHLDEDKASSYHHYLTGFLTAYNRVTTGVANVSGSMTLNDITNWIDGYCEKNPVSAFEQAIEEFIIERTVPHDASKEMLPPSTTVAPQK